MNEPIKKRGVVVGFFSLIGLLFLIGGIMTIGNLHSTFSSKINILTIINDVNGLHSGNNIWFSGVKIGTVKKLEFSGKSQVKVIMNINTESQQYIRKNANIKISTDGLIGNKILIIYGGTSIVPMIEEGDTLLNQQVLSTEDIINTLQQNNLNVLKITQELSDGKGSIGKLLMNDSVFNNILTLEKSLQTASSNANIFIQSLTEFSKKMNRKGSLINELVSDTSVFKSLKISAINFHHITDTSVVAMNHLKEIIDNSKSTFGVIFKDNQTGTDIKAIVKNVETSSVKLNIYLDALEHNFLFKRYFKNLKKKNQVVK
jgi:phospholipid/cholesterol/gamma-HCH transport system substrate-binding protein